MQNVSFILTEQPTLDVLEIILNGLATYNRNAGGLSYDPPRPIFILIYDDGKKFLGGLKGDTRYAWLYIDWLWIDEDARRGGLGAILVRKAEDEARARGCVGSHVTTLSFQAPDFYVKQGYTEAGRISNKPPGHDDILYYKIL